ncbi:hypothetical protein PSYPI_13501 [Pseudomonas syringae pv. pisi str. 1704B]|uniref:Uncharacterized protein n=1 Tax=Pseudomonas syringae pv. pisi str. 1704B TaxID=629263 RepID=F3G8E4_PSESJ|nr:hypothetical protein PSYPI_13501 [Pseudomonas syringae pv. pisi str. 1704B]
MDTQRFGAGLTFAAVLEPFAQGVEQLSMRVQTLQRLGDVFRPSQSCR